MTRKLAIRPDILLLESIGLFMPSKSHPLTHIHTQFFHFKQSFMDVAWCSQPGLRYLCISSKSIRSVFPTHTFSCILIIIITIHIAKVITELAFTTSSNTYYVALMLAGRRFKQIPSKRQLFFSQDTAALWHSMLRMREVWMTEERLGTFKGEVSCSTDRTQR